MKLRLLFACALLGAAPRIFAQDWIPLQDGQSLAGWKAPERPQSWAVEDGVFVTRGDRSHLYYVGRVGKHDFRNFEFSADVYTEPGSNGGIYVHTRLQDSGWPEAGYELQVINSNPPAERMGGYIEFKMTGSIYAVRNTWATPARDNQWFNYRVRVVGKTIQTFIDGELICEYAEPPHPWRSKDKPGRRLGSGTFALQAHDPGSTVKYRNIRVKILPDDASPPPGLVPITDPELDELVSWASDANIPLIDTAFQLSENDSAEASVARRLGFTPISSFPSEALDSPPGALLMIFDGAREPDIDTLKAAKAAGVKVAFDSRPGMRHLDESRIKARLKAIRAAGLGWEDFWVPRKP